MTPTDTAPTPEVDQGKLEEFVEPFANDRLEDNLTPVGGILYSASTTICLPVSRSQEVDAGLGAQAGEARLRKVVTAGGFTRFSRIAQTPFNLVFEARP